MAKIYLVFSTIDSNEAAHRIARTLVEERLAACVSIIPNLTSIYKWKGSVQRADEHLLIIKTVQERIEPLNRRIVELHPYEVPEIVAFPIDNGHPPYLDWVVAETRQV